MKWYCCINEAGLTGEEPFQMLLVALRSCLKYTSLRPHLIYCGQECAELQAMRDSGFTVIHHEPSLEESLRAFYGSKYPQYCGHWLRVDIPDIEQDEEFILYTDMDVMFLKEFPENQFRPDYIACGPEHHQDDYSYFNSGTMVMNVPACRELMPAFREMVAGRIERGEMSEDDHDQVNLNLFFKDRWAHLPNEYNWKPYWGRSESAAIVHFHGPKPGMARTLMRGEHKGAIGSDWKVIFAWSPAGYRHYLGLYQHLLDIAADHPSSSLDEATNTFLSCPGALPNSRNRPFRLPAGESRLALYHAEGGLLLILGVSGHEIVILGSDDADACPLSGDWDGDGEVGIGLYLPGSGLFVLRENLTDSRSTYLFDSGSGGRGWHALAGDWDGDGRDTVGLYDSVSGRFFLRNRLAGGAADLSFRFGPENAKMLPVAGDWTGSGCHSVGLYDPGTGRFLLRPSLAPQETGTIIVDFVLEPRQVFLPLAGDWRGAGSHSVGLFDRRSGTFFLKSRTGELLVKQAHAGAWAGNAVPLSIPRFQDGASGGACTNAEVS